MHRTHTWVKRGTEYIERVPMNWGRTLTLLGAMRHTGWVVLQTMFATANADRFVTWLMRQLLPKLRCGDVLVMDNLRAHHDRRVGPACRRRGIRVLYLPPYSPDLNPIEQMFAKLKALLRGAAARTRDALWNTIGTLLDAFSPAERRNFIVNSGYEFV
jgi:transposase